MLRTEKKVKTANKSNSMQRIKTIQQTIPVRKIFEDGMFLLRNGLYTMTYRFSDINYTVASKEQKEQMLLSYCDVINGIEQATITQLDIVSRVINQEQYQSMLFDETVGDGLDTLRAEHNKVINEQMKNGNGIIQELYMTFVVAKRTEKEARIHFERTATEIGLRFSKLGSVFERLNIDERLRIFHSFYRCGDEKFFRFNFEENEKKGHSFKDVICPTHFSPQHNHFELEEKVGRALFLREYPNYIRDTLVSDLCSLEKNMVMSISFLPIPTAEAVREVELKQLGVETDIAKFQRKQNQNNNYSSAIPYNLQQKRAETKEQQDDLTLRDQRMIIATITLVHLADSMEELDADTENLKNIANKHMSELSNLTARQLDGINSTLPYGMNLIDADRSLTTESTAALMPFRATEICHSNGIIYGVNAVSKNFICGDRLSLQNGNSFTLGSSGSGKSMFNKDEFTKWVLNDADNCEFIFVDPEREWGNVVRRMGGEVIRIATGSEHHINALDLDKDYDDRNPVYMKTEYILSLCNQVYQMSGQSLTAKDKSIIDRCVRKVYRDYVKSGYTTKPPTLKDFRNLLLEQKNHEAQELALALEMWTEGSLSAFAQPTNVDIKSNIICFDILELESNLMPVGMLVILDQIWNRVVKNRKKGIITYIVIDEIYLLFMEEYSSNFLYKLWKRARKYNAVLTGITQNVEDLLRSPTARTMLANSEFITMLNQATTDRLELAKLLNISDAQLGYITDAEPGCGLLRMGSAIVPFKNQIPKDTELYKLMTTKPRETFDDDPPAA